MALSSSYMPVALKVVKLLYRWTKAIQCSLAHLTSELAQCHRAYASQYEEYMNVDNREYIFRVLNDLTKLPFLAEAAALPMDI